MPDRISHVGCSRSLLDPSGLVLTDTTAILIVRLLTSSINLGMLWVMIIVWLAQGQPQYTSMSPRQQIAYISDIGADVLKPFFVTGSALTGTCFFLSLLSMRHNHALIRRLERTLDVLSVLAGFMAAVCLILLAVFDTRRHPGLHRLFLLLFMLGVVLSALFTTIEYRRLGETFTGHPILKISYRFKQVVVFAEVSLSVAFGVTMYRKLHNVAAILEWCKPSLPLGGVCVCKNWLADLKGGA